MVQPKHRNPKVNPPGKIHGGKAYLARRILEMHPPPSSYDKHVSPYGGLASVKLNLPDATREQPRVDIYNDTDQSLVNLFWCIRMHPTKLQRALAATPYSEREFNAAVQWLSVHKFDTSVRSTKDLIEWARRTFITLQQSQGGRRKEWSKTKSRSRRGIADCVSGWLSKIHNELPFVAEVITEWQLEKKDGLECAKYHDSPTTMFYMDPPYELGTRSDKEVYEYEMSFGDHGRLLMWLVGALKDKPKLTGMCLISGYSNELYDNYFQTAGWSCDTFDIANHAAGGKEKRRMQECVWYNYNPQTGERTA